MSFPWSLKELQLSAFILFQPVSSANYRAAGKYFWLPEMAEGITHQLSFIHPLGKVIAMKTRSKHTGKCSAKGKINSSCRKVSAYKSSSLKGF